MVAYLVPLMGSCNNAPMWDRAIKYPTIKVALKELETWRKDTSKTLNYGVFALTHQVSSTVKITHTLLECDP